jgi:hypothetical protein
MLANAARNHNVGANGELVDFNVRLEQAARVHNFNEDCLERITRELEGFCAGRDGVFALTLARITELALYCAGSYTDDCEFALAGDLLVNPRLILIHIRNQGAPIAKERHGKIGDQFRHVDKSPQELIQWLKENTCLEIKKEPLLPHLYGELSRSGLLQSHYLASVEQRLQRIADVIGFLSAWHVPDSCRLRQRMRCVPEAEREFVSSSLCRFDLEIFHQLGHDLLQLLEDDQYESEFLRCRNARGPT